MAIAEHHPEMLYHRNRGLLKMRKRDLREFAATPEAGLPREAKRRKPGRSDSGR